MADFGSSLPRTIEEVEEMRKLPVANASSKSGGGSGGGRVSGSSCGAAAAIGSTLSPRSQAGRRALTGASM